MKKNFSMNQNVKKSSFLVLLVSLLSLVAITNVFGQTVVDLSGSGIWSLPSGVSSMQVELWGGGGGGGGRTTNGRGGGGGGGAYSRSVFTGLAAGSTFNYTAGVGGAGSSTAASPGSLAKPGGNSTFSTATGTVITAFSAGGGAGVAINSNAGVSGGTAANGNQANRVGGNGASESSYSGCFGLCTQWRSGGGGGGAGSNNPGQNGNNNAGGLGGSVGGGNGGAGRDNSNGVGGNATAIGGGGGGAFRTSGIQVGGNGAAGLVRITYYLDPTIGALPAAACAGTTITLTGTNFITGSTTVTFNGIASPAVVVSSATSLTAQIPPSATSGPIVISTLYGATSAPSASYTIYSIPNTPASTLSSNSPQCSPTAVTVSRTGAPTGGDIWYWQTSSSGVSVSIGSGSSINDNVVGSRTYYLRAYNSGCWSASSTAGTSITILDAAPSTTPVSYCAGLDGTLALASSCATVAQTPLTASGTGGTSENTSYTNTNISVAFPALPPGAVITSISTTITYTANTSFFGNSLRSDLRIRVTPPAAVGSQVSDIQPSANASAGTETNLAFGSWGTNNPTGTWLFEFRESANEFGPSPDANINNITITVAYSFAGALWYTTSSGGTQIAGGTTFNPIGVAGSGVTSNLTPGNFTFYAACPANTTCRTATNYTITAGPTQFTVQGGGTYCSDGVGLPIGLSGSEVGVSYQLLFNGSNSGTPVGGTGSVITFGNRTGVGNYTVLATSSGCTNVPMTGSVSISMLPAAPTTTPVSICTGQSGSLSLVSSCATVPQTPLTASGSGGTSNSTSYSNTNISINFPSLPPGAVVTNISTTITYTSNSNFFTSSFRSELRVRVTPPVAVGSQVTDIQPSTNASAGTETNLAFGSWGTGNPTGNWLFEFRESVNESDLLMNPDANISNITISVAYSYAGALWYTSSSGGTQIGGGTSFNPVGVSGSGLANTLTPGTTTYYAACPANTTCRTATDFVINAALTISAASSSPTLCQNTVMTAITHTTTSVTGIASSTGLPAGVTASYASNTITISGTPTAFGTFNYTITPIGCGSATATGTITVNPGALPASVASATGATLAVGDLLWSGNSSVLWGLNSNWYAYDGTDFVVPGIGVSPSASNRVFVLPSSTSGICISGTNSSTVTASGAAKDVYIGTGATLVINAGQSLQVNGDWINNGTFTPDATGTVEFVGSTAQSIGGSSANNFTNLTLNKSSNTLTLNTPVNVSGTLIMTSGNIATSVANLLTIGTSPAAPGSIAWTGGTVVGPLRRYFSGTASATQASGIFPVGLSGLNRYAQVNYTSGLSTGGTITTEYIAGVCPVGYAGLPNTINGQMIQNYENEGYWEITPSGGNLNSATYSLILRGNTLSTVTSVPNMAALRLMKSVSHTTWDNLGIGSHSAPIGGVSDFTISNSGMTGFSFFNIGSGNANPLPVTMLDFAVNCNYKSQVELKWTTASEQNSHSFIVERSRDFVQWESIETLDAAGNSNYNIDYSSDDNDPYAGVSYYRLLQVDIDGTETIYGPISVSCVEDDNSMMIFPNPTKGDFIIEVVSASEILQAKFVITDLSGKVISSKVLDIGEGKNQVYFNDLGLQLGTYIVSIVNAENQIKPVRVAIN